MFSGSRKSWRRTLYLFTGGMIVWLGIVTAVALRG